MGQAVLAKRGGALGAALALGVVALLCWAPGASADLDFCPSGEGAGQCDAQRGLAVDSESERLYVADEANSRVSVFEVDEPGEAMKFLFAFGWGVDTGTPVLESCTTATSCQKGIAGEGAGQLDGPSAIAVDNDPASPSQHAIYVADANLRVQKFDPTGEFVWTVGEGVDKTDGGDLCTQAEAHVCGKGASSEAEGGFDSRPLLAVGPAGVLYVVDNVRDFSGPDSDLIKQRLQRFEPSGAQIPPQAILREEDLALALAIAVDAAGDLWVGGQLESRLRKYCAPSWALCAGPFPEPQEEPRVRFAAGLAIDAAGDVYAAQIELGDKALQIFNAITAFDPTSGEIFRRFAYSPSLGNLINGLAAHESTLGDFFSSRANLGITYASQPPPGPVIAPPSLEVEEVGSTKARLLAEVNPEGKATSVHFEYLTEAEYDAQGESFTGPATKSTTPEPLGATGFNLKAIDELIGCPDPAVELPEAVNDCLAPETTYRWRAVATNADGGGGGPVEGPPFTTKPPIELGEIWATRVGTDTARLNAEVNPNLIPATGFFEYVDDAAYQKDVAESGDGFGAAIKAPAGAPLDFGAGEEFIVRSVAIHPLDPGTLYHYRLVAENQLIEVEGPPEELRTFAPPEVDQCANDAARIGAGAFLPDCRAYEMVSPLDKEGGDIRVLQTNLAEPAVLEQSAVSGEKLAYGSSRSFDGAASAPFTSQYIARRIAGEEWETHPINSPRGEPIIGALEQFDTEFKIFSAELCDAWITTFAEPPLSPEGVAGFSNLYRRTDELCSEDGEADYEALAPLAVPEGTTTLVPFRVEALGVSEEGEHAIFTAANGKLAPGTSEEHDQLYENAKGTGLRFPCVLPEGGGPVGTSCTAGTGGEAGAQIGRISSDGERIFWSSPIGEEGKIYVRIGGSETVAVSRDGEEESGASGSWFWGAATDGSVAIFSTEVEPGLSDLHEFDVDAEDNDPIAESVLGVMGISEDASRVYFASTEVLSGEETNSNGDKAQAGKANLYLREADGSIEFVATLASADLGEAVLREPSRRHTALVSPDGAHAAFVSTAPLTGYDNKDAESGTPTEQIYRYDAEDEELLCVSCNPSGARPTGRSRIPFWQSPMHAARILSEDGSRLYFESPDTLAARDSNGRVDVYQWEEPDTGGCDVADGSFSPDAGGCVDLISSGQSPLDSRFVEADPTANDVFFATGSSLLPQDFGVVDIYDARIGGGLPIPPVKPPPCEGDTCAAQVPAPEEPTPASSEYVAPPEAAKGKPAKRRCAKGKRRVSRKGKSRCVAKRKRGRVAR